MSRNLGRNLIFLIGQPRSGTTLLQTLLGQHPDVFTYSESWILLPPLFALRRGKLVAPAYGADTCTVALEDLLERCEDGRDTYFEAVRNMVATLYDSCLKASGKRFFLDKSPPYYLVMEEIAQLFPEAKMVIIVRNPLAVLSSIAETWFDGKCSLILDHPIHIHNVFVAPIAIVGALRNLGNRCHVVKYEDLVAYPGREMQSTCEYLGIQFSEEMLSYRLAPGTHGRLGDKTGVVRHTRVSTSALDNWKSAFENYANYRFAMSYLEYLGPDLLSLLGYEYEANRKAISDVWDEHSSPEKIFARASHWTSAVSSITLEVLAGLKSQFQVDCTLARRKHFFPRFPPSVPDFSMLEHGWQGPVATKLEPRMSLESYWPEFFPRSNEEGC